MAFIFSMIYAGYTLVVFAIVFFIVFLRNGKLQTVGASLTSFGIVMMFLSIVFVIVAETIISLLIICLGLWLVKKSGNNKERVSF